MEEMGREEKPPLPGSAASVAPDPEPSEASLTRHLLRVQGETLPFRFPGEKWLEEPLPAGTKLLLCCSSPARHV